MLSVSPQIRAKINGNAAVRLPLILNDYQQLMLRLGRSTPYNAVHCLALFSHQVKPEALLLSINAVVRELGLGYPEFSSDSKTVTFLPLKEPLALETRALTLNQHIDIEMNALFGLKDFPLRFFIVTDSNGHYLSITYNHWIADGHSIYCLMQSIANHFHEKTGTSLSLNAPRIEECYPHVYKNKAWYYRYSGVVGASFKYRTAYRVPLHDEECTQTGTSTYFFEKEVLQGLTALCKAQGITFNDLLIALLAQLFGRLTAEKRQALKSKWFKPRRDKIVVSVITNIRSPSQVSLRNTFGLFLGFFSLMFKSPEQQELPALSQDVHQQTKTIKQNYTAIKEYLLFKIQNRLWDTRKSRQKQYRLFSKNTPITVGISNMNLNQLEGSLLNLGGHYLRFSPTAMVCPIVFNLTTFNGQLSLGINYRKTCYTAQEIEQIQQDFVSTASKIVIL